MAIAVVDYCKGNLRSVQRGVESVGGSAFISSDPAEIARADALILPGVGAFADAAATMESLGQMELLREMIAGGVPFLGICLGLHLLFERGEEGSEEGGSSEGLGVLGGTARRLPAIAPDGTRLKIPHVGWNTVELVAPAASEGSAETASSASSVAPAMSDGSVGDAGASADPVAESIPSSKPFGSEGRAVGLCPILDGIPTGTHFYFTHSYAAYPEDLADVVATTTHGEAFCCAVAKGDVFGVQFHPEKSSAAGMRVLSNFVRLARHRRMRSAGGCA